MKRKFLNTLLSIAAVSLTLGIFSGVRQQLSLNYINDNLSDCNSDESIYILDDDQFFYTYYKWFTFKSSTIIDEVKIEGSCILNDYKINENDISVKLSNFENNSSSAVVFYKNNKIIDKNFLHFSFDINNNIYMSSISLDTAKRNAGNFLNYQLINDEEIYNRNLNLQKNSIGVVGSISGYLKWEDQQENIHPLIGAKVKVTINGSWWNEVAYSNQDGFYSINYNDIWYLGSGKPTIHIFTEGDNVKVSNGGTYCHSYEFNESSGDFVYSYTFSPKKDGDLGKAMMVFQGLKNFENYISYLNGNSKIEYCTVEYPNSGDSSTYSNNVIKLSGKVGNNKDIPDSYAAWDVLGHEYGHHVQKCFNIADNPGGPHTLGNHIDYLLKQGESSIDVAKSKGYRLSWGEGWATFFSVLAQKSFHDDLKTIYTVGDDSYTSSNGLNYSLDKYGGQGDADETSIQRFLYKLFSTNIQDYDRFNINEYELWNIVIKYKPIRFYEFINGLYNEGYSKDDLSLLMSKYNIISGNIEIIDNYIDKLPNFRFSTYMGSDYIRYNNFDIYVYDQNKNILSTFNNIETDSEYINFRLDEDILNLIYENSENEYYVQFVAKRKDYLTTGNYYSELFKIELPNSFSSSKVQIKPSDWGFDARYYFQDEIDKNINYRYSIYTTDYFEIKTDRLRCGYIENSYINLSPRRNNAGTSYFEMNFNVPIYSFMYGICLWSNNEKIDGDASLLYKDSSGNWIKLTNLLNDIKLTSKEEGIKRYCNYFSDPIFGFRFEASSSAIGTRNKGRLCIEDIVLSYQQGIENNQYYYKNYKSSKIL